MVLIQLIYIVLHSVMIRVSYVSQVIRVLFICMAYVILNWIEWFRFNMLWMKRLVIYAISKSLLNGHVRVRSRGLVMSLPPVLMARFTSIFLRPMANAIEKNSNSTWMVLTDVIFNVHTFRFLSLIVSLTRSLDVHIVCIYVLYASFPCFHEYQTNSAIRKAISNTLVWFDWYSATRRPAVRPILCSSITRRKHRLSLFNGTCSHLFISEIASERVTLCFALICQAWPLFSFSK